ncbi:MAG: hypothetical protein QM650_14230 [Microlunatus sp.]
MIAIASVTSTSASRSPSFSAADEDAIDIVTREYYRALVSYDCDSLRKVSTDGDAACRQITPETERTPMPVPVDFGKITTRKGQIVQALSVADSPCSFVVQEHDGKWLAKTPPGLNCRNVED